MLRSEVGLGAWAGRGLRGEWFSAGSFPHAHLLLGNEILKRQPHFHLVLLEVAEAVREGRVCCLLSPKMMPR